MQFVTGSNFQSWSTSKYLTAGTTLHIIDMTKLHPSCIIKVTWFSVDIISPLLNAFFLHIIVVLTATGYPLHLLKYLLLEKDPVTKKWLESGLQYQDSIEHNTVITLEAIWSLQIKDNIGWWNPPLLPFGGSYLLTSDCLTLIRTVEATRRPT